MCEGCVVCVWGGGGGGLRCVCEGCFALFVRVALCMRVAFSVRVTLCV